jgi:hypothetical protein
MINECVAVWGMRTGKGNRRTRRNPTPVTLCRPKIRHDLTCDWTRPARVGSRRLTAWAMVHFGMRRVNRFLRTDLLLTSLHKCWTPTQHVLYECTKPFSCHLIAVFTLLENICVHEQTLNATVCRAMYSTILPAQCIIYQANHSSLEGLDHSGMWIWIKFVLRHGRLSAKFN